MRYEPPVSFIQDNTVEVLVNVAVLEALAVLPVYVKPLGSVILTWVILFVVAVLLIVILYNTETSSFTLKELGATVVFAKTLKEYNTKKLIRKIDITKKMILIFPDL